MTRVSLTRCIERHGCPSACGSLHKEIRRLQYATKALPSGKIGWRYDLAIREQWRRGPAPPEDLWPAWRGLACPTLVVRGTDSDILSVEAAQPHAREVEIRRAGHMVFEDNPDAFLAAVRAFLHGH